MNIYERDSLRYKLLIEFYQLVDGDTCTPFDVKEIGANLQLDSNEVIKAFYYFYEENLIGCNGSGYSVTLTHTGIKVIESMLRKIDFKNDIQFNNTELYQLRIILDEIKNEMSKLHLGHEIIFNKIDETYEQSKSKSKKDWKEYFENQIKDWSSQKIIDFSSQLIIQALLMGLKVIP